MSLDRLYQISWCLSVLRGLEGPFRALWAPLRSFWAQLVIHKLKRYEMKLWRVYLLALAPASPVAPFKSWEGMGMGVSFSCPRGWGRAALACSIDAYWEGNVVGLLRMFRGFGYSQPLRLVIAVTVTRCCFWWRSDRFVVRGLLPRFLSDLLCLLQRSGCGGEELLAAGRGHWFGFVFLLIFGSVWRPLRSLGVGNSHG